MRFVVKFTNWLFLVCAVLCCAHANNKQNEISIPMNNWTSQRVLSYAVGSMIQTYGYNVIYHDMPASDQWGAMKKGLVHFQIEIWQQSMSGQFNRMIENNYIVDLGVHDVVVREEWWYPKYVEELCPGLPDWQALNRCATLFARKPGSSKGVFYTIDWDYQDADLIRALGLHFTIERLNNENELWQLLEQAWENKTPVLIINWTPNWTDLYMPGNFVQFPKYSPACEVDASWGQNSNLVNDCGNPQKGWLRKAGWTGLQSTYPCVYNLLRKLNFSKNMIADASALVIVDGHSEQEAAKKWLEKYNLDIAHWLESSCVSKT
ncbi:ABC transporter substrate-binding protein [Pseudoalteromonas obscura]|uniref:ABC transporter substrate-binding protein n=1 Tax=Pseudoalteromonas obscura TaxID=3048491 RepID=A0ABT7EEL6_9GAMM|nr:ABC transporter substrate-binding protein [Pseudoalteromonas sp. P94(2023)]MDK2593478.1 ABC transporter substrate-binding protein [Pseudoalteromonas sp. P94(2023)]